MKTNAAGIDLIKSFEGLRLKAYKDPIGIWTIGYGHTSAAGPPKVVPGLTITADEAGDILAADLTDYEAAVTQAIKRFANENQFAAMVSLCYNIGPGNFRKSSVCRHFNDGQPAKAASAFLMWNKAGGKVLPGLTRRRAAEMALFNTPVPIGAIPEPPTEPIEPQPEKEKPMPEPVTSPVVVIDNPPQVSKINWTQIVSMAIAVLATFGIAIPDEWQPIILQALLFITPIVTMILRTWFTGKEPTKPQLKAALAEKDANAK